MRAFALPFVLLAPLVLACSTPNKGTQPKPEAKASTKDAPKEDAAEGTPSDAAPPIAAGAKAEVGSEAPDFTLTGVDGKAHKLSDHRGKTVVLEWFNPQCPFVNHAHTEGSLVSMAKEQTAQGVVWLAINSGAVGKQGHGAAANVEGAKKFKLDHPILLDESGAVGHAYGAEKTPHVYLIDPAGKLLYRGAIDNAPFGEVDGEGEKVNYLALALEALGAGDPISTPETPPYGCTVKY